MVVAVYEDNLIWSARLERSIRSLGHEPIIAVSLPAPAGAEVAVVNMNSPRIDARALIPALKSAGLYVIAHAGHKERELRELGVELGADRVASNSELTFKIEQLLGPAISLGNTESLGE
jgi:hypothetical protein